MGAVEYSLDKMLEIANSMEHLKHQYEIVAPKKENAINNVRFVVTKITKEVIVSLRTINATSVCLKKQHLKKWEKQKKN